MCEEQRGEDVDGVDAGEFVAGDGAVGAVVEGLVGCYAGVVDEYVDLERARGVVGLEECLRGVYDFGTRGGRVG